MHASQATPPHPTPHVLPTGTDQSTRLPSFAQAEKIEQLNRDREAVRQERLRRLQPAAVPVDGPADAEQAR